MTLGTNRVRATFNPSGNATIDEIKQKTAELIDLCQNLRDEDDGKPNEKNRLVDLAQTSYEEAAMWAVKAATSP